MARQNGFVRRLSSCPQVKILFQGPHGYISPTWYEDSDPIPTWNYSYVEVDGRAELIDDRAALDHALTLLGEAFENGDGSKWHYGKVALPIREQLTKFIIRINIYVETINGKFKLSQNKSRRDRLSVIEALGRGDFEQRELSAAMAFFVAPSAE